MNIQNIEKKEKNMATFEVKVPADVFDNAVNEAYKKNKNHLYVAGFRKGKAPRAVIEGMYGKEVFYPDAIEALADTLAEDGRIGAAGPRIYLENGTLDHGCKRGFPTPWNAFCYFSGLSRRMKKHPEKYPLMTFPGVFCYMRIFLRLSPSFLS